MYNNSNINNDKTNNYKKVEENKMNNIKEMFNKENFDAEALTNMIESARDVFKENSGSDSYIWVSFDTLEAERSAFEINDLKGLENGFVVKIVEEPEEYLWEGLVRCFVEYFNENFDRDFDYEEWYEPDIAKNDEKVFTDEQLCSVFESFQDIYLENIDEYDPYYIMVDMQEYKAVKAVKKLEPAEDRYVFVPVENTGLYGLSYIFEDCCYALNDYFDTHFDLYMYYNFEIYD